MNSPQTVLNGSRSPQGVGSGLEVAVVFQRGFCSKEGNEVQWANPSSLTLTSRRPP